jgi:AcrR family transcriptional regulator
VHTPFTDVKTIAWEGGEIVAEPVPEPPSRRERARADTLLEIKETARRLLVEQGPGGVALRAVAREMGMTAPALYRYFTSHEDLVQNLVVDLYDELSDYMEAARDAVEDATTARRLLATSRAFRTWATTHHAEFGLLFGSALENVVPGEEVLSRREGPIYEAGQRFGGICAALLAQLYLENPFPVPTEEDLSPELQAQLGTWCERLPVPLPLGVTYVFLHCWIRLYGMVCMEIFGHLRFALDDAEPMFEAELRSLAERLGVEDQYIPPS